MADEMNTDERAKFETALKSLAEMHGESLEDDDFSRSWPSGEYSNGATEVAWMLWQARAALSPDACDMATASAQGFRDGVASLSAAEPADDAIFEFWWADHMPKATQSEAWAEWCALRSNQPAEPAIPALQPVALPSGWVPLVITHEGQHPEEVAYGPQIMMDRLGKWLGKYFAKITAPTPTPDLQRLHDLLYTAQRTEGEKQRIAITAARIELSNLSSAGEPQGYWDGEFNRDGGATLYEVPQVSAFGRQYRNVPLYTHPAPTLTQGAAIAAGAVYAELPEARKPDPNGAGWFTAGQMLDFADRTHALRASHGQAPAQPGATYVCAQQCHNCCHAGINDEHSSDAACNSCGWSGPSPKKDHCPGCGQDGTMTAACPMCSGVYVLVAEARIDATPSPQAAQQAPAGAAEPWQQHMANQAEVIDCEALQRAMVQHGISFPEGGMEYFRASLGEMVNRFVRFAAPAAPITPASGGWISVDERLPEPDGPVLAHNGKWTGVAAWMSGEYLEPLERWQDEHREFIEMMGPAITHWMPLPASPTIEGESNG